MAERKKSTFRKKLIAAISSNTETPNQAPPPVQEPKPIKMQSENVIFQMGMCTENECEAVGHMKECWACGSDKIKQYVPTAEMKLPTSSGQQFSADFEGRPEQ